MRILQTLVGLTLLSLTLAAQLQPRPAVIEGVVKNLKTGAPLADVRVTASPEGTPAGARSATTDAEGRFTLTALAPGRYTLAASRTLFFRPRRNSGTTAVTVSADQRLRDVQILLLPTGVVAGRIVNENREPLRSVRVEALRSEYRDGVRTWVAAGQTTTDDRGEYRLFNLQPGTYYVRAAQSGPGPTAPALYYPGVLESQDASPLQVEGGGELGAIDIVMRRIPEFWVQLKLGGQPEDGLANFSVQRRSSRVNEQLPERPTAATNDGYRIERLAPGAYDIFVQVFAPAPAPPRIVTHAAKFPVNVGNDNVDLGTVPVSPAQKITGMIVAAEPLPTALDAQRLTLILRAPELSPTFNVIARGNATPPAVAADGSFTLTAPAARYQIALQGLPPDTYLVSARTGAREVLDTGYVVSGSHEPLELRVAGPGAVGSLEGTVVNARGESVPASTVVLVPATERRGNSSAYKTTSSDQLGNFSIRPVLSGEYKVFAWEDVEAGAWLDPEFLRNVETRGEAVRIGRGAQSAVTVRVIPGT